MPSSDQPPLIRHLKPTNFLSFGPDNEGIELQALNLLIGPNGSGKSNLIEAISFMRAAPKDLQEVTRKGGGVAEWIWKGAQSPSASVKGCIEIPDDFNFLHEGFALSHEIQFRADSQRLSLSQEHVNDVEKKEDAEPLSYYRNDWFQGPEASHVLNEAGLRKWTKVAIKPNTSVLANLRDASRYPELFWLADQYEKIRIYREWSFGRSALFREPQQADMRNDILEEDFSNLALFLSNISIRFPVAKRKIIENLRDLYEGLTDYQIHPQGGTVQIFFNEGDFAIPATRLSDGTLRYLCLLAILCDPEPPPLICIEEPELGLHPDILPKIADLLKAASKRTQLIVTTHSDILVDAMTETPEVVVVCEKHEGKTEMKRLSAKDLAVWLEKYRLGQLWVEGQLGGKRW